MYVLREFIHRLNKNTNQSRRHTSFKITDLMKRVQKKQFQNCHAERDRFRRSEIDVHVTELEVTLNLHLEV